MTNVLAKLPSMTPALVAEAFVMSLVGCGMVWAAVWGSAGHGRGGGGLDLGGKMARKER